MARTRSKSEDVKKSILEAATQLIIENGVSQVNLMNIAERANISTGTLYYYFKTKNEILCSIAEKYLSNIKMDLDTYYRNCDKNTPLGKILWDTMEIMCFHNIRGKLNLYLLSEAIMGNESLQNYHQRKYYEWLEQIGEYLSDFYPPNLKRSRVLQQITLGYLEGFTIQCLLDTSILPDKEEFINCINEIASIMNK